MSGKHYFYERDLGTDFHYITDKEHDDVDDAEDDEDSEFLQDIPYSSSSLDRSSIGSIPWADDAIKQNQLDWERVERMLSGQEELTDEPELRNEILEWQKKFPQLLSSHKKVVITPEKQQQQSFGSSTFKTSESLDIDSIANLKLDSFSDDEDGNDGVVTPINEDQRLQQQKLCPNRVLLNRRHISAKTMGLAALKSHRRKSSQVDPANFMERDLRINSVPMTLCKKNQNQNKNDQTAAIFSTESDNRKDSFSSAFLPPTAPPRNKLPTSFKDSSAQLLIVPPSPIALNTNYATTTNANMRMPPILNVLESKRRFRGLLNNRSFVQLTQVQQAKSAAVTSEQRNTAYVGNGSGTVAATKTARQTTAWHMPLAAATISDRFFNNRNSIILPAINLQHTGENPTLTSSGGEILSGSSNSSAANVAYQQHNFHHMTPQRAFYQHSRTRMSTTTATTPSTGGRSISAAVHPRSRYDFNAFYLPYSASKFKVFK